MLSTRLLRPIRRLLPYVFITLSIGCAVSSNESKDDFLTIFDGKTLDGWEGDSTYWRVENGALVGEITPSTLLQRNSFIIWRKGVTEDFELELECRISSKGNSGINYRSEEIPGLPHSLRGYQCDIEGGDNYSGSNYEERKRTTLASRGQQVELNPLTSADTSLNTIQANVKDNFWSASKVTGNLGTMDSLQRFIKKEDWNQFHIIAKGNRLQHYINGVLMSDVTDNDTLNRSLTGLLGVQVHVGPPMKVEYRNIRLKHISK
jgi:hypothetical protein